MTEFSLKTCLLLALSVCEIPFLTSILNTSPFFVFPMSLWLSPLNNPKTKIQCYLKVKMLQYFAKFISIVEKNTKKRIKTSGYSAKTKLYQ